MTRPRIPLHALAVATLGSVGFTALAIVSAAGASAQPIASDTVLLNRPDATLPQRAGFTNISGLREISDGTVLVADRAEHRLLLVDWESGTVRQIGRDGKGPGEYEVPRSLYPLAGDSTLLTDARTRRWFLLFEDSIIETYPGDRSVNRVYGSILGGADRLGNILGATGFGFTNVEVSGDVAGADSLRITLITEPLGERPQMQVLAVVGGLGLFGQKISRQGPYVFVRSNPLGAAEQAALAPDGWVAIAHTKPYRVDWRTPEGEWRRGGEIPHRVVTDAAIMCESVLQHGIGSATCDEDAIPPFPNAMPPYWKDALLVDAAGRLVVARTPIVHESHRYYDVIDRHGRRVKVIATGLNQRIVGFGTRHLYVVEIDALDLQHLQRFRLDALGLDPGISG